LEGIAYSTDEGQDWHEVNKGFPAPLGNLSWAIRGRGGFYADGYVYAIATEREFKCEQYHHGAQPARGRQHDQSIALAMARGLAGDQSGPFPRWSSSFATATPILFYPPHITYPQMSYDSPLHRYLLTFSFSYSATPPAIWQTAPSL